MDHAKQKQMNDELKGAQTLKQIIDVVNKYYNLDQPLGIISGPIARGTIPQAIHKLNIKPR